MAVLTSVHDTIKTAVTATVKAMFPGTVLTTRVLDHSAWESYSEDPNSVPFTLTTPLLLIVEKELDEAENPFNELMAYCTQMYEITVHLILGEKDCVDATINEIPANGATMTLFGVDNTTGMFVGQTISTPTETTSITVINAPNITVSPAITRTVAKLTSRINLDCYNLLTNLREQFVNYAIDNCQLLRPKPIRAGGDQTLNKTFAGNGISKWSANLTLTYVVFYQG